MLPPRTHLRQRGSEVTGALSLDPALLQTDSGLLVLVPTRDLGEGFEGRQRVLLGTERGRAQARSPGTSAGRAGRRASQHELYPPVGRETVYTTCPLEGLKHRESRAELSPAWPWPRVPLQRGPFCPPHCGTWGRTLVRHSTKQ